MKHATAIALDALEPLLRELRRIDGLIERKRGVFYRGPSAFLHFHEDPAGFFADAKVSPAWVRFEVTTAAQRRALLREVRACLRVVAPGKQRGWRVAAAAQPRAAAIPARRSRRSQPRAAVPRTSQPRAAVVHRGSRAGAAAPR